MSQSTPSFHRQALDEYMARRGWRAVAVLSDKRTGIVTVAHCPGYRDWIIRASEPNEGRRSQEFINEWAAKGRPFLPGMSVEIFEYGGRQCVIEHYEYIGAENVHFDTEINVNEENRVDQSGFQDLFKFSEAAKVTDTLPLLYEALCGLGELHNANWYHLDFSLENIGCDGRRAVLLDFEASLHAVGLQSQVDVGKCYKYIYAAPELVKDDSLISPGAIDVWAFGVALCFVVARADVFRVVDEATGKKILRSVLFEHIREHGFEDYAMKYVPQVAERISCFPHLMDLLQNIFVVYESQYSEWHRGMIYGPEPGGRLRFTIGEVQEHAFWGCLEKKDVEPAERMHSSTKVVDLERKLGPKDLNQDD